MIGRKERFPTEEERRVQKIQSLENSGFTVTPLENGDFQIGEFAFTPELIDRLTPHDIADLSGVIGKEKPGLVGRLEKVLFKTVRKLL